jgi:hypothetical protein
MQLPGIFQLDLRCTPVKGNDPLEQNILPYESFLESLGKRSGESGKRAPNDDAHKALPLVTGKINESYLSVMP